MVADKSSIAWRSARRMMCIMTAGLQHWSGADWPWTKQTV